MKHQVAQLDSELGCLSLQLIERESEVHAKSAHCQQLELKLTKYKQDMKQMIDDFGSRMKSCQDESSRQEAAILEYAEKLRKVQVRIVMEQLVFLITWIQVNLIFVIYFFCWNKFRRKNNALH